MLRRRLAVYTLLFAAGITAGFFMHDRQRPLEAAGFTASVLACVMLADGGEEGNLPSGRTLKSVKPVLAVIFICGLLLFSVRSAYYDSMTSSLSGRGSLKGRVISAEAKDDDLIMIVRCEGTRRSKVRLTVKGFMAGDGDEDKDSKDICRHIGSVIEAAGEYGGIMPADDPGCFDYRLYMRSRGVAVSFKAYSFETTDPGMQLRFRYRRYICASRESFLDMFDEGTSGFLRGVIFGDKSEIDEDTVREFNENSTGHILAVSGLHIGFLYGLLRALTGRKRTAWATVLILAAVILYGGMTMWSPATVRACAVMGISLLSLHFRRPFDLLTSVSLAALLILIKEPYQLFSSGFQMSFLAMCGIAFLTKPIASVTGEALGVMLAVQAGTLPVTAYTFCRFNPLAMLINEPVILLASLLVPLCIIMLMLQTVFGTFPHAAERLIDLISYAVIRLNHMLNAGGGFSLKAAGLSGAAVIAAYMMLLGLASEWTRVRILRAEKARVLKNGLLLLLPVMMLGACMHDPFIDDEIVFAAVGQGDCVHIRAGGHDMLIDGGGSETYNVGEKILMPYLLHGGSRRADMAMLTHLHTDHCKGIAELSEIFPVGAVGIPADYRGNPVTAGGIPFNAKEIVYILPGTRIDITEDIYIEPIWPVTVSDEPFEADDANEHNTVYMIHYNGVKVMVTGDLLEEDELRMLEYYEGTDILKCDVLKVAHHGSKSSSSEAFLDAASPSIAVIQVGRGNLYGHPHQQTLDRLEERGITVFRTDINGATGMDIRHGSIYVDLFHSEDRSWNGKKMIEY